MTTKKSVSVLSKLYFFVTHVSHDRMHPTVLLNRDKSVAAAVLMVSSARKSRFNSNASLAQGIIMKPRSCVVRSCAFWCKLSVQY
jgi:hypothetical protein